ncbi:MAG: hypothetical protein MJZ99_03325 [Bacteroidales bacterium]|nr:hypothetical protein [Candidatus Colimorpha merdihippi]MCQ2281638.1 hypothetical protein [Bacteroidales bacterium]
MKKFLVLFAAALMMAACGKDEIIPDPVPNDTTQDPVVVDQIVNIIHENIGQEEFKCRFEKADSCVAYWIMEAEPGTQEQFLPMFGFSCIEDAVQAWGIKCVGDTAYTWKELAPATDYVVYVVATTATGRYMVTDTLRTASRGGHGESVITVSVDNITATSARTIAMPNEETALFKDLVITCEYFNEIGADSVRSLIMNDYYEHYSSDVWIWESLDPSTDYYFCAMGKNIDGVWGQMATTSFSTPASK